MSNENEKKLKYCVYCGAKTEGQAYCPNCGKLVSPGKPRVEKLQRDKISPVSEEISRKCSGCGSIITSTILEQCPICNTLLEPVPDSLKPTKSKPGFIFEDKKLKSEQELIIKKDSWNMKEGLNIFILSLFIYVIVQVLLFMFIWSQLGESTSKININLILISQIPGIALGIYPLWYIYSNKHKSEKLGFTSDSKKIALAILIGIVGGLSLVAINYVSDLIISFLIEIGLKFFDISEYLAQENKAIKEASFLWIILLLIMLSLQAISTEIVFRGVLHNTLKERFEKDEKDVAGKLKVILIIALVYSGVSILFSYFIGIIFFILNFLVFLLLGILYEINKNILNTIIASILYFNMMIILIYFL